MNMAKTKAKTFYKIMSFRICEECDFRVSKVASAEKRPMNQVLSKKQHDDHKKYHALFKAKHRRRLANFEKAKKLVEPPEHEPESDCECETTSSPVAPTPPSAADIKKYIKAKDELAKFEKRFKNKHFRIIRMTYEPKQPHSTKLA